MNLQNQSPTAQAAPPLEWTTSRILDNLIALVCCSDKNNPFKQTSTSNTDMRPEQNVGSKSPTITHPT